MSTGRRLVLWRHGRTEWNAGGRFQGRLDSPLDPAGVVDIALAAQVLAELPPTALVTSSAPRARRTAAHLERETGLVAAIEPGLQELDLGLWQGLSGEQARERFPDEYAAWIAGQDVRRGGGETYDEVGARATAALTPHLDALEPGATLVATTHGGTVRAIVGAMLGLPVELWSKLAPIGNVHWTTLVEHRTGWRLAEFNAGVTEPVDRARAVALHGVAGDADAGLAAFADI